MSHSRSKHILILLLLIALGLGYFALERSGMTVYFSDSAALVGQVRGLGVLGPGLIIGLMIVAVVLNPLPSAPIAIAAGAVYGHTLGTVYIVVGAELGAIAAFFIARTAGYEIARQYFDRLGLLHRADSQNGLTLAVFVARLLPFMSFDLVSYAAGVTPLKAWRFALATLLGLVPMSFLLAHMGSEIADGGVEGIATAILILGLLVALPLIAGLIRRRHGKAGSAYQSIESNKSKSGD